MNCDTCGSTEFVKNGTKRYKDGKHQMWQCTQCGASKKGEVIAQLPKGKPIQIEMKPELKKKPDLHNLMHKI